MLCKLFVYKQRKNSKFYVLHVLTVENNHMSVYSDIRNAAKKNYNKFYWGLAAQIHFQNLYVCVVFFGFTHVFLVLKIVFQWIEDAFT